jgi:tRNA(fMet)-specific endonuclease VapC
VKYLLDTNAIIRLTSGHPRLERKFQISDPDDFGIPVIVRHELYFGAFKSRDVQTNLEKIRTLRFEIVPFDDDDARRAGEIRANLRSMGTPIGPFDTLIAGQALARDLTLITHNTREFSRVAGLRIEDWEA